MTTIKPIIIFLIVVAAAIATFAFGKTLLAVARGSQPVPILQEANTDEWQTYVDERFHFSFKYPPDWYLNIVPADSGGGGVQISNYDLLDESRSQKGLPPDYLKYLKIEIIVVGGDPRKTGQSLEEWRRARGDYDSSKAIQENLTTVNGIEAFEEKVEWSPGMETTTIYLPYSDKTYGETVLFISANTLQRPILEEVFRKIVSTFEFTK